jgi:hypothetical protein
MTTIDIESTNGHATRKSRIDDGDSLSSRLKSLRIEALARKKELESQKAAIEKELSEIDETFGFDDEPKAAEKPKVRPRKSAPSSEPIDIEKVSAKISNVIVDYRTKGVSLATLAELVDAPKEAVTKALKPFLKAGTIVTQGKAKGTTYHPAE